MSVRFEVPCAGALRRPDPWPDFQAIARRIEAGQLADAVTLKGEFEHSGILEEVGGTAYLAQLLSSMVGIINAAEYGRAIHDSWLRRQLIDIGETVVNNAFGADAELDGSQQIEAAEQSLFQLATDGGGGDGGFITFEVALTEAIQAEPSGPFCKPAMSYRTDHRPPRSRRQTGRLACLRSGNPCWPSWHGQIGAGDQDRIRRGESSSGTGARGRAERSAEEACGDLFAGNERRTARHAPVERGVAHRRRPYSPRRYRPEGFR